MNSDVKSLFLYLVFARKSIDLENRLLLWLRCVDDVGEDPLAVLRWALVRVFFRACFAFVDAGRQHRKNSAGNCTIICHSLVYWNNKLCLLLT